MDDILDGVYSGYLQQYAAGNGYDSTELMQKIQTTTTALPQVFAALVKQSGGAYVVTALHRPAMYASVPGDPLHWDDRMFAFTQDIEPGNYIDMIEFPVDGMDETQPQQTPTMAQVDLLLAADQTLAFIPVQAAGANDTESVTVRNLVPIPHRYVHLILTQDLTPRQAWDQIGGAIRNDGAEVDCDVLLQWLRVSLTLSATNHPATYLGTASTVFPPLRVDRELQRHRWRLLIYDFPHLNPSQLSQQDQTVQLINSLRADRAAERAADAAARAATSAPKLPAEKFPETTPVWMRYCMVVGEEDLPGLYHRWANAAKAERRIAFQAVIEERARQPDAATNIPPFATKELYEHVLMGRLAPRPYEAEDLTIGISPFTCGFQNGERDRDIIIRTQNFDLMMQGHTQPTLAEQETFRTKDVPIPRTIYEAGLQIKATSVVLDVVLGTHAPLCAALREFCLSAWPHIEAHLNLSLEDHTPILPLILCWVQLEMAAYLQDLNQGRRALVPAFGELERIITRRAHHQFAPMPTRYMVAAPAPAAPAATGTTPAANTATGRSANSGNRDPGDRVENPSPVPALQTAFNNAGIRIAQLREHAPTTLDTTTNTNVPICLSYHLRGSCYSNCQRAVTHRALTAGERRRMTTFASQHLPAGEAGTPAPAQGNAPAPPP